MARAYFPIFFSSRRTLMKLSPEQVRNVLFAAMDYAERGAEPSELDEKEQLAFENLRIGIDSTERKYQKASERGRRNGAKGGRPRKGSGGCEQDVKTQEEEKEDEEEHEKEKEDEKDKDSSYRRRPDAVTTTTTGPGEQALAFWADNVGPVGSYLRREVADVMAQGAAEDLVLLAMERAIDYGGGRWAYARSILQDARRLGVTDAAGYRASSRPRKAAAAGSMKARSGESPKPMKNVFDRDWNAVFDGSPDGSE